MQEEEHPDSAKNQTTTKPAEPPQRPITLNHLVNTKNGQPDSYEEKNYRLQKRGLWIQALLCFFTALAFGAAAYYAYIANRQLEEIRIQNVAQQRAILVVSQSPRLSRDGHELIITYENKGHVTARVEELKAIYSEEIGTTHVMVPGKAESSMSQKPVPVGERLLVGVKLPPTPAFTDTEGFVKVDVSIDYDDGFGHIEPNYSCFQFSPKTNGWSSGCGRGSMIDVTHQTDPDWFVAPDATLPPTPSQQIGKELKALRQPVCYAGAG